MSSDNNHSKFSRVFRCIIILLMISVIGAFGFIKLEPVISKNIAAMRYAKKINTQKQDHVSGRTVNKNDPGDEESSSPTSNSSQNVQDDKESQVSEVYLRHQKVFDSINWYLADPEGMLWCREYEPFELMGIKYDIKSIYLTDDFKSSWAEGPVKDFYEIDNLDGLDKTYLVICAKFTNLDSIRDEVWLNSLHIFAFDNDFNHVDPDSSHPITSSVLDRQHDNTYFDNKLSRGSSLSVDIVFAIESHSIKNIKNLVINVNPSGVQDIDGNRFFEVDDIQNIIEEYEEKK
ncbi:MAG: hypothetical protein VZR00_05000 [Lachnospiraceae bacterium]|jgi:hypothetical protein|nr:hypothetical protein [Lachnospiraceae bacterium]MEE3461234.1 hypothetical protein [Lachnospiraceae bacterium]